MGGLHRHRVHHGVDSHARQAFLLVEGDAQLVERLADLGVNLVKRAGRLLLPRRGIVADGLEIDVGHLQVPPLRRGHGEPVAVGLQAELKQPLRLMLEPRDKPHHILVKPHGDDLGVDVGHETVFVFTVAADIVDDAVRSGGMIVG